MNFLLIAWNVWLSLYLCSRSFTACLFFHWFHYCCPILVKSMIHICTYFIAWWWFWDLCRWVHVYGFCSTHFALILPSLLHVNPRGESHMFICLLILLIVITRHVWDLNELVVACDLISWIILCSIKVGVHIYKQSQGFLSEYLSFKNSAPPINAKVLHVWSTLSTSFVLTCMIWSHKGLLASSALGSYAYDQSY